MEEQMRSLLAMIFAMMVALPGLAQQDQSGLRRVHLMTGAGTIPRNPANRLEYLRYATTGEPRLTGTQMIERIPEVQKFARVTVESDEFIPYDQPQELKALNLMFSMKDIIKIMGPNSAAFVQQSADIGTLEAGKLADIVVLPGNPLDGYWNLLNATMVIKGGEVVVDKRKTKP